MEKEFAVSIDDTAHRLASLVKLGRDEATIRVGDRHVQVKFGPWQGPVRLAWVDGVRVTFAFERGPGEVRLYLDGAGFRVNFVDAMTKKLRELKAPSAGGGQRKFKAPMPGVVLSVGVMPGQRLAAGDPICVLEAMKMQNEIRAETAGIVTEVAVTAGQNVQRNDLLAVLGPLPDDAADSAQSSSPSSPSSSSSPRPD